MRKLHTRENRSINPHRTLSSLRLCFSCACISLANRCHESNSSKWNQFQRLNRARLKMQLKRDAKMNRNHKPRRSCVIHDAFIHQYTLIRKSSKSSRNYSIIGVVLSFIDGWSLTEANWVESCSRVSWEAARESAEYQTLPEGLSDQHCDWSWCPSSQSNNVNANIWNMNSGTCIYK